MFKRLIIFGIGLWLTVVGARGDGQQDFRRFFTSRTHTSLSGQFVVHDAPVTDAYPYYPDSRTNLVRLDPTLFMVSCEHIKKAVLDELGARDQWQGRIILDLFHNQNPDDLIEVTPSLNGGQWTYRVALPDFIERYRAISVVVQMVMLEIANRHLTTSAEIPTWLAEGMTRQVMRASQLELILEPPTRSENGVTLRREVRSLHPVSFFKDGAWDLPSKMDADLNDDPIARTLVTLRSIPALGLEELSWPKADQFQGDAAESYRASAQLFVHQLLHLPNGRAEMQSFIGDLGQHLNWQLTFLQAFHAEFGSQLQVEKWWSLRLVQLTGRELFQSWTLEESWSHLNDVLNPSMQIRSDTDDLPMRGRVKLQAVITDLNPKQQQEILIETSRQLATLHTRVSPELTDLVDGYRRVLDSYLRQKNLGVTAPTGRVVFEPGLEPMARDAVRELDALDQARKSRFKPVISPQPVVVNSP